MRRMFGKEEERATKEGGESMVWKSSRANVEQCKAGLTSYASVCPPPLSRCSSLTKAKEGPERTVNRTGPHSHHTGSGDGSVVARVSDSRSKGRVFESRQEGGRNFGSRVNFLC